jgi:methyltransferase (TIGR00027 family)
MTNQKHAVADTGLLVAAMRAEETGRVGRLFSDPFADALCGARGRALLADYRRALGPVSPPIIEVRTRHYDEALHDAGAAGARQFVILAAGRDARAYRIGWPAGSTVFEVDQPAVIAAKDDLLVDEKPLCRRVSVGCDLADDWPAQLRAGGFSAALPTVWLVEGLLQYLHEAAVLTLFDRIDALSAAGSTALYDVVGTVLLNSPFMAATREFMADLGAPWTFGTDEPAGLVEALGWSARLADIAERGDRWGRWPGSAPPLEVAGVPRGYLVTAAKP